MLEEGEDVHCVFSNSPFRNQTHWLFLIGASYAVVAVIPSMLHVTFETVFAEIFIPIP